MRAMVLYGSRQPLQMVHMSDLPAFPYALLWAERTISSVANLTRRDGEELLALAPRVSDEGFRQRSPFAG